MEKQFVTYKIALALKELGFDEECFAQFNNGEFADLLGRWKNSYFTKLYQVAAPLWQQAIDWLLQRLDFYHPMLEFQLFADHSGTWYESVDKLTDREELDIAFDNLEDGVLKGIELCKKN